MTPREIADIIIQRVAGSSQGIMTVIDIFINDGDFSQEEFLANEMEILSLVDDDVFECEDCGWTLWTSMLSHDSVCDECVKEDEND